MQKSTSVVTAFKQLIRGTEEKARVVDQTILVCVLTNAVYSSGHFSSQKVYVTTKVIKHLYDRKPAEEFEFILHRLEQLVKYPDHIYENKQGKRGSICFVKQIAKHKHLCSLELSDDTDPDGEIGMNYIVTAFRVRERRICECIISCGAGRAACLHRNTLVTGKPDYLYSAVEPFCISVPQETILYQNSI